MLRIPAVQKMSRKFLTLWLDIAFPFSEHDVEKNIYRTDDIVSTAVSKSIRLRALSGLNYKKPITKLFEMKRPVVCTSSKVPTFPV